MSASLLLRNERLVRLDIHGLRLAVALGAPAAAGAAEGSDVSLASLLLHCCRCCRRTHGHYNNASPRGIVPGGGTLTPLLARPGSLRLLRGVRPGWRARARAAVRT